MGEIIVSFLIGFIIIFLVYTLVRMVIFLFINEKKKVIIISSLITLIIGTIVLYYLNLTFFNSILAVLAFAFLDYRMKKKKPKMIKESPN